MHLADGSSCPGTLSHDVFSTESESPEETQTVPLLQGPDKDEVRETFISRV